jgi:hypothetical protein
MYKHVLWGSVPIYANEDEVEAKIDRQVAELASNGTGRRWNGPAARSAVLRTRSPRLRPRITRT